MHRGFGGKCTRKDFQLAIAQKETDREVKLAKQFGFVQKSSGAEQFAAANGSQDEIAVVVRGRFDGRPVGEAGGYLAFPTYDSREARRVNRGPAPAAARPRDLSRRCSREHDGVDGGLSSTVVFG